MSKTLYLADADARKQFTEDVRSNHSVVASAGSGKTHQMTERVANLALRDDAVELLPGLVVVTYTRKAAEEARQRVRAMLVSKSVKQPAMRAFDSAYFGTIHSFAVELLKGFGSFLGLPARFKVLEDDAELWREFINSTTGFPKELPAEVVERLVLHLGYGTLLDLVRIMDARESTKRETPAEFPAREVIAPLLATAMAAVSGSKNRAHHASLEEIKAELKRFIDETYAPKTQRPPMISLPECGRGGKDFVAAQDAVLRPIRNWLTGAAEYAVFELAKAYRNFRISRGYLNFADQIELAAQLAEHPLAGPAIRRRNYAVLLDEAQDTDPRMFDLLLEITRPEEATGLFLKTGEHPPGPGRFTMVGDFQQSIYKNRADIAYYRQVHDALVNAKYADGSPVATALTFTVTFRCDQTVVDFANRTFPFALTGQGRQASYVPLHARENAGAGTVVRLPFAFTPNAGAGGEKKGSAKAATHDSDMAQARFVAKWMAERGPSLLGARRWSEVAILLPRKEWFLTFKAALAEQNIGTQIASPFGIMGHSATYGWVTAVATAISEPRNHFEIYGVLREIFGFSDEAIANYVTRGNKAECNELRLDAGIVGDSPVAAVLRDLAEIRQKVLHLPVREGLDLLISQTGLHGRLMSLPEEQRLDLEGMLDYLTELASSVDVNDGNFALFANAAKQRFFASAQPTPSAPEKVVLITNQKAKGLQWDCVIVPYIAKAISSPPPRYPSLLPRYAGGGVAFSSNDIKPESDTAIRAENLNEIQRIGYVTVTRAKHTLVLVDDATGAEKLSPLSLAHALTVADDKKAQAAFLDLPGDVSPEQAMEPELLSTPLAVEGSDEGLSAEVVAKGVEAAGNFCVRILPHTKKRRRAQSHFPAEGLIVEDPEQAKTGERDFNAPAKNGSNGVDYGIWFHSLMQFFPWSGSDAQREAHVQERLKLCPLLSRGTEEAARLLASPLAAELRGVQWTLHPEFRVFAVLEGNKCIDGSLDLLAKEVKEGSLIWYIYDYKTDVRSSLEKLAIEYGPQMTNYADALRTILGPKADIRGRLYSTVKGLCIDVHL